MAGGADHSDEVMQRAIGLLLRCAQGYRSRRILVLDT